MTTLQSIRQMSVDLLLALQLDPQQGSGYGGPPFSRMTMTTTAPCLPPRIRGVIAPHQTAHSGDAHRPFCAKTSPTQAPQPPRVHGPITAVQGPAMQWPIAPLPALHGPLREQPPMLLRSSKWWILGAACIVTKLHLGTGAQACTEKGFAPEWVGIQRVESLGIIWYWAAGAVPQ
uniref:Uncharacterized protein n=1 Tax=Spironucleus salmonicida TaxID=348837 RepID=V6LIH0_9EUKA|eukprot:EST44337.1 Hypothetical protein SS50377_15877 [Spironucleus salmonicida]